MTAISPAHSSIELDPLAPSPQTRADNGAEPAQDSPTGTRVATPLAGLSQRAYSPTPSQRSSRRTPVPASPAHDAHQASVNAHAARVRTSGTAALPSHPGDNAIEELASPATEHDRATAPVDLPQLQQALDLQKNRPIDLESLAEVLRTVRFSPKHRGAQGSPPSHRDLVRDISDQTLLKFHEALGLDPNAVRGMNRAAYQAGLKIPSSSTIFNILSYVATPLAFTHASSPWNSVIASLLLVAFQPLITAPLQSLVIGSVDYRRRLKHPEIKLDKTTVNASTTQPQIKRRIDDTIAAVRDSEAAVVELCRQHKLIGANGLIDPARIDTCTLSNDDKRELTARCRAHLDQLITLCTLAGQMHALDGAHARQIESTIRQILPRTIRSGSGFLAPFLRKYASATSGSDSGDVASHKLSPYGVTGISVLIAVLALIGQHFAAAQDEVNGLRFEHKLNMLHADLFEDGKADVLHRSGTITAADLSIEKCRNMVVSAEANIVQRVADSLETRLATLKNERGNEPPARPATPEALEEGRANHARERDEKIAAYERDVANLRHLTVTDTLHEDTLVLLRDALNGTHGFAWEQAVAKLTKPLEFTSQVSQRIGQTFTLGVLGSAGALAGGRVVSAALKGSDHISLPVQFTLVLASAIIGLVAASTQGMVTNIKNQRRDANPDDGAMSFSEQTIRGMGAPIESARNAIASRRGIEDASVAIAELQEQARQMGASLERLTTPTPDERREA
ncbi:hypothetical protein HR51_32725 [Burkholderia cepacia]|nr:hypothetical protein HR51_32725 [Burkholderia cepacia]